MKTCTRGQMLMSSFSSPPILFLGSLPTRALESNGTQAPDLGKERLGQCRMSFRKAKYIPFKELPCPFFLRICPSGCLVFQCPLFLEMMVVTDPGFLPLTPTPSKAVRWQPFWSSGLFSSLTEPRNLRSKDHPSPLLPHTTERA